MASSTFGKMKFDLKFISKDLPLTDFMSHEIMQPLWLWLVETYAVILLSICILYLFSRLN